MSSHSSGPSRDPRPSDAPGPRGAAAHRTAAAPRPADGPEDDRYEYLHLTLPRGTTRGQARALLTEHAEYGRWELSRVRLFVGGGRQVRLRRRIIRVRRTA